MYHIQTPAIRSSLGRSSWYEHSCASPCLDCNCAFTPQAATSTSLCWQWRWWQCWWQWRCKGHQGSHRSSSLVDINRVAPVSVTIFLYHLDPVATFFHLGLALFSEAPLGIGHPCVHCLIHVPFALPYLTRITLWDLRQTTLKAARFVTGFFSGNLRLLPLLSSMDEEATSKKMRNIRGTSVSLLAIFVFGLKIWEGELLGNFCGVGFCIAGKAL